MKKISVFILLVLLTSYSATAQKTMAPKKLNWGLKTGINISKVLTDGTENSNGKTGLVFGAFFKIKVATKFSLQPEFLYSSMGGKNVGVNDGASLRLNYFSIPVLAKYNVKSKLAVVAGPQIDVLIQAKTKGSSSTFNKVTDSYREYSFNGTLGLEYWPTKCLGLSGRAIYGFTDISLNGNPELKNSGVQITAAVKL